MRLRVKRRRYRNQLDLALLHEGNFATLPIDRPVSGTEAMEILQSRTA